MSNFSIALLGVLIVNIIADIVLSIAFFCIRKKNPCSPVLRDIIRMSIPIEVVYVAVAVTAVVRLFC